MLMRPIYRNLHDGADEGRDGDVRERRGLGITVQRGTYKLLYEAGAEDELVRRRGAEDTRALRERAGRREDERRRRLGRLVEG